MFGAEPLEKWTKEEAAEFETYASEQLRRMQVRALWATAVFALTLFATKPFLAGHSLHAHWIPVGQNLVLVAMCELPWIVLRWGYVYSAWQSAREVRYEMKDWSSES